MKAQLQVRGLEISGEWLRVRASSFDGNVTMHVCLPTNSPTAQGLLVGTIFDLHAEILPELLGRPYIA